MLLPPNFSYCCFYRDYRRINTFQSMTNQDNSVILVCSSPLARMLQLYRNLSAWRMLSEALLSQVPGLSQLGPRLLCSKFCQLFYSTIPVKLSNIIIHNNLPIIPKNAHCIDCRSHIHEHTRTHRSSIYMQEYMHKNTQ